jgi:hypothetical protein
MTTATTSAGFAIETTTKAPDRILPQKAGQRLWAPMLVMALLGFAVAVALTIARSVAIDDGTDPVLVEQLNQYVPAAMFFGFATVFAAISFAIARILGEFRVGGGGVQQVAGSEVRTLKMPNTAKAFLVLMMMAMMIILAAVVAHVVVGVQIGNEAIGTVTAEQWSIGLEAARRFGVALYLFAITLGLATIITVVRFQSIRIREVAHN